MGADLAGTGCTASARRCAGAVSVTVTVRVPVLGVLCSLVVDCPVAVFIDVVQVADLDRVGVDGGVAVITVSALSDPAFLVAAAVCGAGVTEAVTVSVQVPKDVAPARRFRFSRAVITAQNGTRTTK